MTKEISKLDAESEKVIVALDKAEALILFQLLFDFYDQPSLEIKDISDRWALVGLSGVLESTLVEPFMKNYDQIIGNARENLVKKYGNEISKNGNLREEKHRFKIDFFQK